MRLGNLFALSLLWVSCSADVGPDSPLPQDKPEAVGMTTAGLDRIPPAMQRYIDEGIVGGIITMVARRGKLVHWNAVGYRELETRTPLQPTDILRICSMTKPITSVGVMMLVESGKIALADPVSRHLPAFERLEVHTSDGLVPLDSPVTIADLLAHTSGLTYGQFGDTPVDALYRREDVFSGDLQNLVDEVSGLPLVGQPGSIWNYGVSTDVLGRVIEVVSGQPLDEFLKERVFDPLEMEDTDFYVPPEKSNRVVSVYVPKPDGALERLERSACSNEAKPQLLSGGGGLLSTAPRAARRANSSLSWLAAIAEVASTRPAMVLARIWLVSPALRRWAANQPAASPVNTLPGITSMTDAIAARSPPIHSIGPTYAAAAGSAHKNGLRGPMAAPIHMKSIT
jgi:CubicO group peptidase (beta-lactamase class C family)